MEQAPAYSKLHRYSFVRELGRGSHGTVLLVRKKIAPAESRSRARGVCGNHDPTTAAAVEAGPAAAGPTGLAAAAAAAIVDGAGTTSGLRVLKESQHLTEAVNEARLLLLAGSGGGGGGGGGGWPGYRTGVGGDGVGRPGGARVRASLDKPAAAAAGDGYASVGSKRRVGAPSGRVGEGKGGVAAGGRVHQSGEVVQVMRKRE